MEQSILGIDRRYASSLWVHGHQPDTAGPNIEHFHIIRPVYVKTTVLTHFRPTEYYLTIDSKCSETSNIEQSKLHGLDRTKYGGLLKQIEAARDA